MADARHEFLKMAEQTLNFELLCAGDSPLPPGHTTGWRTLPCTVIGHISGTVLYLDIDRRKLTFRERAYCITPGVHHCSYGEGGRCRWAHVNFTVFGGIDVFNFLSAPPVLKRNTSSKVAAGCQKIARIAQDFSSIKMSIRRKALGLELLAALLDEAVVRDDCSALVGGAQRLAPVLLHIRENLSRRIELEELARIVHLSSSRFAVVFHSMIGLSPRDYLQRERLQKAQELLIQSDLSIHEVGSSVGWENPFFFSRLFTKKCGQTPSEYRRHVRSGMISSGGN
jgi:AraC-like DNA-binding protein